MTDGDAGPSQAAGPPAGTPPPAGGPRPVSGLAHRRVALSRGIGSPVLFSVIWTSLASAVYFSLGVVANHALGLTPVVFLVGALLFGLTAMTYMEGSTLHQDRGGATVFARYAFNELVSFAAGWAILLDYIILIAITAYSATQYLRVFWAPLGHHGVSLALSLVFIAVVVLANIRGFAGGRARRIGLLVAGDLALQLLLVIVGLVLFFNPHVLTNPIHLGSSPKWSGVIFALTITTIAFTSLESAAGLSGEVQVSARGLRRLVTSATVSVLVVYVGISLVAVTALPVHHGHTALGTRFLDAPMVGIVLRIHPHWLGQTLKYVVGAIAAITLVAAANSAMMGLSRLAYSLSTNRQIPASLGRLHPRRGTPVVVIVIAGIIAAGLVIREDLDFLVGIYAFGALLAFTIAHLSICRLRYSEPERDRPYRVPLSISIRGGYLPVPAVIGTVVCFAGWLAVMVLHAPARNVGLAWMAVGLVLYVAYRRADESSLLRRVTIAPAMLAPDTAVEQDYGSILVPLFGSRLDDDIVQTAALLVAGEQTDEAAIDAATIEAVWVFEIPMSLPIDARLPEGQIKAARTALARAKVVGEEYTGVQVATATIRARRAGHAIVEEARRRGVEAIVLGAEEPSRIRGGTRLGGRVGGLEGFMGEVARYVIAKATCRVIVTAPPALQRDGESLPGTTVPSASESAAVAAAGELPIV